MGTHQTNQTGLSDPDCKISDLASGLSDSISKTIQYITTVNDQTRLLSFNAQIEAARAGGATGAAFSVVAQAIRELSDRTAEVADEMRNSTSKAIANFNRVAGAMDTKVRGTRLVDLAHNNIDLIDRNLYERTCDVRWWATDSSLVDAMTAMDEQGLAYASKRMGIILSAYTVYYDLVLVDLQGKVVANGRPDLFPSVGADVSQAAWYRTARAGKTGDDYGFETCHPSMLTDRKRVLAYSCAVREGGEANGRQIGVLGALFNWDDLAQVIVKQTPLPKEEWPYSRVCIVDNEGKILADSRDQLLTAKLELDNAALLKGDNRYEQMHCANRPCIVAYAKAPGYETYSTGWHSVIVQDLAANDDASDAPAMHLPEAA